jgi:hypothetical protein
MKEKAEMVNRNRDRGFMGVLRRPEVLSGILIVAFMIAAVMIMYVSPQVYRRSVHEGDIALKDIYAPYDFEYEWGLDEERTGARQAAAAASVPFYLERDEKVRQRASGELERFFGEIARLREAGVPPEQITASLKGQAPGGVPEKDIKILAGYDDTGSLRKRTAAALGSVLDHGYIASEAREEMKARAGGKGYLLDSEDGTGRPVQADELITGEGKDRLIDEAVKKEFPSDRKIRSAAGDLIASVVSPNIVLDRKKTETEVRKAIEQVDPVYQTRTVKKNELVIGKGIRVDSEHIAQFERMRSMFGPGTTPAFLVGVVIFFGILLFIAAGHTLRTRKKPGFLRNTKDIGITLLNMFLMIVIADFIMNQPQPSYFIPLAGMGMLITLLVGFNAGFMSVVIVGTLIAFLMAGKIEVFFVLLTGGKAGMLAIRGLRRRARILVAGLLVGAAKALAIVSIGLINGMEHVVLAKDAAWGVASGIFSGFLVMGLLPFFEHVFKVPTNISLLELSDLNHPLLKKLAMEAPGTYHHSIMVGNLSEAACDSIGANSLLARVGAYYHDIGKIPKAEYFSENEMGAGSKHEKLAPSMSALIISKHVKEGVEIGRQHKLNSEIIDFIRQHHGDSLIAFFYQKALEKAGDASELKEENFRYPGPRPQTKERAIVLLADAVEASSRALEDPTPSSIRNLVKKIINNKFIDGQLDECDLTLRDMHNIAKSFERVLMGMFHVRVPYPEEPKKNSGGSGNEGKDKLSKPKRKNKG